MRAPFEPPPEAARRTGPVAAGRGNVELVWERRDFKAAPAVTQLTAQDRRFLRSLADWPLALLPTQRAWLRHLAGGAE